MEKLGSKLRKFSSTKTGELLIMVACLGLAYLFFSLAIDKGNIWYYLLSIGFFVYWLKYLFRLLNGIYRATKR